MPPRPPLSKKEAPLPRNHLIFDPWNTGFSGHERAQDSYYNNNTKTAAYRDVRTGQLQRQFRGISSVAVPDTVYVEEMRKKRGKKVKVRGEGEGRDIREYMGGQSKPIIVKNDDECSTAKTDTDLVEKQHHQHTLPLPALKSTPSTGNGSSSSSSSSSKIFTSLTFYINGSTFPLISDHKLRHIIAENGGALSISLARRSVTHVIIPSSSSSSSARCTATAGGGGLSAAKLQKEIATTAGRKGGGIGMKFVGVDCVKAGKRLPEARFVVSTENKKNALVGASRGQRSVYGMFKGAG